MSGLFWLLAGAAWAQTALVADNLSRFRAPAPPSGDRPAPRVSVLVPARDEAPRIGRCVGSVLAQTGVDLRLVVLDDRSDDGTAAAARAAAAGDPRLTVLAGRPLPDGWAGKPHACHQLAEAADGDWWLFLDADTALRPGAVAAAVAEAETRGADLLSLFPAQVMGSRGEQLMLPLLMFVLLGFLPLRLAERLSAPSLAAANGQFLLFRPAAYAAVGGHAACRADMVEDMALARAIKAAGRRLVVGDGTPWVSCRMYDGFGSLWRGFRKNLYPAFGGRPGPFLAGWGALVALGVAPAALAVAGWAAQRPDWWAPGLAGLAAGWVSRALLAARLGQPGWSVPAHPLAVGLLGLLALESWRGWARGGVAWKGRVYGRAGLTAAGRPESS
jgi:hypothetical protein